MIMGESPAVARRRLRLALRRAREAKQLTQGQVATALDWSLSKMNRIESGEVTISSTDLRALLQLYDVTDGHRVAELLEDAKASRRRGWWDDAKYREHLTPAMLQLLQFESEASAIRHFNPTLIGALMQTRAYARQLIDFWSDELSEEVREVRLEVRMQRRGQVFDRSDPPDYLLTLDESVLYRKVGGPKVMVEQLEHLLDLMKNPKIMIRVVPFTEGAAIAMLGAFTIMDLGDEENAVLYRESNILDEVVHTTGVIARHRRIFEQLWAASLSEGASMRLIEAHAAAMRTLLDRPDA